MKSKSNKKIKITNVYKSERKSPENKNTLVIFNKETKTHCSGMKRSKCLAEKETEKTNPINNVNSLISPRKTRSSSKANIEKSVDNGRQASTSNNASAKGLKQTIQNENSVQAKRKCATESAIAFKRNTRLTTKTVEKSSTEMIQSTSSGLISVRKEPTCPAKKGTVVTKNKKRSIPIENGISPTHNTHKRSTNDVIGKYKEECTALLKQKTFSLGEICFAKLTGHCTWPAKVFFFFCIFDMRVNILQRFNAITWLVFSIRFFIDC